MESKHYKTSLVFALLGLLVATGSEDKTREAAQLFEVTWFDAIKAVVMGGLLGFAFKNTTVKTYINSLPFGVLLTGVWTGVVGLGLLGAGIVGATILYFRFYDSNLLNVPAHISLLGLAFYIIYLINHYQNKDE